MLLCTISTDSWVTIDTQSGHRYEGIVRESTRDRIVLVSGDNVTYITPRSIVAVTTARSSDGEGEAQESHDAG